MRRKEEMRKEGKERRQGEARAMWNCGEVTKRLLRTGEISTV